MKFTATILGRRWSIEFDSTAVAPNHNGECDAPDMPKKAIRLRRGLAGEERLEVLIHESLHAAAWHQFDEQWVCQLAKDLARLCWRAGLRWP
jgi:hypothetical protein